MTQEYIALKEPLNLAAFFISKQKEVNYRREQGGGEVALRRIMARSDSRKRRKRSSFLKMLITSS